MSANTESRSIDNDPSPAPTVAEAIGIVATWDDLSTERRRGLTSSLRAIARIAETDPANLRLTPAEVNAKVLRRPPQVYGLSAASMAAVRSNIRFAMRRLGQLEFRPSLTPAWAELRDRISFRERMATARLLEFHSLAGIQPAKVSDETFERCQEWVVTKTICRNPASVFTKMRFVWNRIARENPDMRLPTLGAARCRVRKTIALADMHPAMQAALAKMAAHLGTTDLDAFGVDDFGDESPMSEQTRRSGPRRALRPVTIEGRMRHVRQAVWVAVQIGVPLAEITSLSDLVTPPSRAKQIIRFMWDAAGKAPSAPAGHVAEALRQIAKYHVGLPKIQVDEITKWQRSVSLKYSEMTEKNRRRLAVLLTPQAEAKLLALPKVLMEEARELLPVSSVLAVAAAKRALFVHFELFYALRVKNIALLRRDKHFIGSNVGSLDVARFLIGGHETKNSRAFDRPVLALTNVYIRLWEEKFRPLIAAPGNPYFFPGLGVNPMCRQAVAASLKKIIVDRVGCEVNIHLLRHRASVAYLKLFPGEFGIVGELLGHTNDQTARRSYTGPERDAAFDRFDDSVLNSMTALKKADVPKHRRLHAAAQTLSAGKARAHLTPLGARSAPSAQSRPSISGPREPLSVAHNTNGGDVPA